MQPPKPYHETRPWGEFSEFTKNVISTVKIITVLPNEAFSLQKHKNRDEFWKILEGDQGQIIIDENISDIIPNGEYFIPRGSIHRIIAGPKQIKLLEISFGNFDENDIERIEDKYNRE